MNPPPRVYRKLSSRDAGLIMGGVSRSTMRRRAEAWVTGVRGEPESLPPDWRADKELRAQGESWVFYVPDDDVRLGLLAAATPDAPQATPAGRDGSSARHLGPDSPVAPGPPDGVVPTEPGLSLPAVRDALIAPLIAHLDEVQRQATVRWQTIADQREMLGRLDADAQAALDLAAERQAAIAGLQHALGLAQEQLAALQQALVGSHDHVAALRADLERVTGQLETVRARRWWWWWAGLVGWKPEP
jgi:hypothetical protein